GYCGLYIIATIYRGFTYVEEPIKDFWKRTVGVLTAPFRKHRMARKLGSSKVAKAKEEKGALGGFAARIKIVGRAFFGKRGILATAVNWALPIASCIFLFNVVSYANNQNYALKLTVNGDFVGYISDETTFTNAQKMVQNRINYTGSDMEVFSFEPVYEIESIGNSPLLNQYQVADSIIALLGKEVSDGYGLYLGDSFYGTLTAHDNLDLALSEILAKYSDNTTNETVEFEDEITYIQGTYLQDSFVSEQDIIRQFRSPTHETYEYTIEEGDTALGVAQKNNVSVELLAEQNENFDGETLPEAGEKLKITVEKPFLNVKVTREEHYKEEFGFDTEYIDDSSVYAGNNAIKTKGVNGEYSIVAKVSYINGEEVGRQILTRLKTKEPTTQVVAIGTKPRTNTTAPGQTIEEGKMLWPVGGSDGGILNEPVYWKGGYGGHRGVDILAPAGTPIYAAENGVVTGAAYDGYYNGGKGNYVEILGSDSGLTTHYYHASEVVVYKGQRVTAGDLIAYVGFTGATYAYHLHFGVSVGNSEYYLDPYDYLPWHQMTDSFAYKIGHYGI
ncbi:MAG: M23 family metallopeptidase, partial [Oscillospiraceae bacterium]|nr:M23 family metallopeptidase [Oscillospiraceae bacterium]